jgi:hypothetical protein
MLNFMSVLAILSVRQRHQFIADETGFVITLIVCRAGFGQ